MLNELTVITDGYVDIRTQNILNQYSEYPYKRIRNFIFHI